MGKIFFETRKKNGKFVELETEEKHVSSTTLTFIKVSLNSIILFYFKSLNFAGSNCGDHSSRVNTFQY